MSEPDRGRRVTARRASAVVVAGLVVGLFSGLALGVVWWQLAPSVPVIVRPGDSFPQGFQPEGYLAADATFGVPIAASVCRIWRCRLLRSTTSSSAMRRWPTPAAAR